MNDVQLATRFMRLAKKYEKMSAWAIPPELNLIFLGKTGWYPLFLLMKALIQESDEGES